MTKEDVIVSITHLQSAQFRYREQELARILHCWGQGQSVLLTGIRRTGKSALMKAALARHYEAGGAVGFLDVQDCISLQDFYHDLLRLLPASVWSQLADALSEVKSVPDRLLGWFRAHVDKVSVAGTAIDFNPPEDALTRYWQPLVEKLEQVLGAHNRDQLPVIGIDELPFMLENLLQRGVDAKELTVMLGSLRKLRDAGLRLIIAGSVSMENLLTLNGIPHTILGGLSRETVPPFSREEARGYLQERLMNAPAGSEPVLQLILETLPDYVPDFLNTTVTHLIFCADAVACKAALRQQALPAIRRAFLNQFDERLDKNYLPAELIIAHAVLDTVACAPASGGGRLDGRQLPEGYRRVLLKLQYDNFLMEGDDFDWRFSLELLRQWWCATRGLA